MKARRGRQFVSRLASGIVACASLLVAREANAGPLSVRTIEFGSWPGAVAALQGDVNGEARSVHVFVRDEDGRPVPCDSYTLTLDAIGARAFSILECDATSGATRVRLDHRAALFAHDDIVPTPLAAGITAVEVRTAGAAGGAANVGGSEVTCSVAVRPFMTNLENGTRVYLSPGRFVLRTVTAGAAAESRTDAWAIRAFAHGTVTVQYEVLDTLRNVVVVRDQATLTCANGPPESTSFVQIGNPTIVAPARVARVESEVGTSCATARLLSPGAEMGGSTLGGARRPVYRVEIAETSTLDVGLNSSFGGEVDVYAGCPSRYTPAFDSTVFGGGDDQHLRIQLPRGIYYLAIVDADIHRHAGTYWLRSTLSPSLASDVMIDRDPSTPEERFLREHPNCQLAGATLESGVRCSVRSEPAAREE